MNLFFPPFLISCSSFNPKFPCIIFTVLLNNNPIIIIISLFLSLSFSPSHTGSNSWQVVSTGGAVVQGGYGHSSVYDRASGYVFLHGGYKSLSSSKYGLVDHLYRYHVHSRTW